MNTELSLATSISMPGGRFSLILGSMARTAALNSKGLAVALRITPRVIASRPFNRVAVRSDKGPWATRATSLMRTGMPLTNLMVISPNSLGFCKSVAAVTLNSRRLLSMRPAGTSRLDRRKASSTSWVVNLKAARRSGSIQMRIEYLRSPNTRTSEAPGAVCIMGLATRLANSLN